MTNNNRRLFTDIIWFSNVKLQEECLLPVIRSRDVAFFKEKGDAYVSNRRTHSRANFSTL